MAEMIELRKNWAPWWALLLGLAALFSNAGFFIAIPGQQAISWLSIAMAVLALILLAVGIKRAFAQPEIYGSRSATLILGIFTVAACGLALFASIHARQLPSSSGAPQVGQRVPDFTLADTNGKEVSLTQLEHGSGGVTSATSANATPKAVLLIFYRGYW
jgi:hypothetical protein